MILLFSTPGKLRSHARRARRARASRGRARNDAHGATLAVCADRRAQPRASETRDLAEEQPWELSLGRSRARRRAAELRFVPASSRAKRISLGALAALTVGPTAGLADGQAAVAPAAQPRTADHDRTRNRAERGKRRPAGAAAADRPSEASKSTASSGQKPNRRCAPSRRAAGSRSTASSDRDERRAARPGLRPSIYGERQHAAPRRILITDLRRTFACRSGNRRRRTPRHEEAPAAKTPAGAGAVARLQSALQPAGRRRIRPRNRGGGPPPAGPPRADR